MTLTPIRERARAKVNLTLHILGKRPDGYHELDSLVVFADLCDELSFTPAPEDCLTLEGPFGGAIDGENLIFKAKRVVAGWLGREIYGDFRLNKNIPVAAGVGGGSSDAAAAIRILLRAYGNPTAESFIERAAAVGADVPVCLYNRAARMRGLGERVAPAANMAPLPAILVNPRIKVSTAEVFKRLNAAPTSQTRCRHRRSPRRIFRAPRRLPPHSSMGVTTWRRPPWQSSLPLSTRSMRSAGKKAACSLGFPAAARPASACFPHKRSRKLPQRR